MGVAWNLAKSRFWPLFLTILHMKIVYIIAWYFICRFFFTISTPIWLSNEIVKRNKKVPLCKSRSIQFLESFCNQKRYFELTSYGTVRKEIYDLCYHFIQYYINLEYHHTYVYQIRLKVNSWKNDTGKIWDRRTCVMAILD